MLLLVLSLGLFSFSFAQSYAVFSRKTTIVDHSYLAVFSDDNSCYCFRKAKKDMVIYVDAPTGTEDRTNGEISLFKQDWPVPSCPILFVGAEFNLFVRFGVAGELNFGAEHRANLTKGHTGARFRVYYHSKRYSVQGREIANLDVDDTSSYGPETITILSPLGAATYSVQDYTNRSNTSSQDLSYSGAVVTVFKGGRQIATYNVPVGHIGTSWTVFELVNGEVTPVNRITNEYPR